MATIDIKISDFLPQLAGAVEDLLEETLGERVAFVLIVGRFNVEKQRVQFVSNAQPKDLIELTDGLIAHLESGAPNIPESQRQ